MNFSSIRVILCLVLSLILFVACNQGRHLVSTAAAEKDLAYIKQRNSKIEKIQAAAKARLGKPYKLGSTGPKSFDCSGFTSAVFEAISISLPRMAKEQSHLGKSLNLDHVQAGDLLFFGHRRVHHVALVTKIRNGNVYITHATNTHGVIEEVLNDSLFWKPKLKQVRRIIL